MINQPDILLGCGLFIFSNDNRASGVRDGYDLSDLLPRAPRQTVRCNHMPTPDLPYYEDFPKKEIDGHWPRTKGFPWEPRSHVNNCAWLCGSTMQPCLHGKLMRRAGPVWDDMARFFVRKTVLDEERASCKAATGSESDACRSRPQVLGIAYHQSLLGRLSTNIISTDDDGKTPTTSILRASVVCSPSPLAP